MISDLSDLTAAALLEGRRIALQCHAAILLNLQQSKLLHLLLHYPIFEKNKYEIIKI